MEFSQRAIPATLKNVLFAMDFSAGALSAFPFAVGIADHFGGKLFIAHITPGPEDDASSARSQLTSRELSIRLDESLLGTRYWKNVPYEVLFDHGSFSGKLSGTAQKHAIDLIVLGTHGWHGIRKLLRGSTAAEIAFLSTKPVLIVGPKVTTDPEFSKVLYVADLNSASAAALPIAFSIAEAYRGSVCAVHVDESYDEEPPADTVRNTQEFFRKQAGIHGYSEPAADSELVVDFGPRSERILEWAKFRETNLIVLGLSAGGEVKARIASHMPGSTSYDLMANAACPVLSVPFRSVGSAKSLAA